MYTYFFLLLTSVCAGQLEYYTELWDEAVRLDLIDQRERIYLGFRLANANDDITSLYNRYIDLHDAPALQDHDRLIDRQTINHWLDMNRSYEQQLKNFVVQSAEIRAALDENSKLYRFWDKMRDCQSEYYYVAVRRQAMKDLRTLMGEADYYAGRWWPYVPLWRFRVID